MRRLVPFFALLTLVTACTSSLSTTASRTPSGSPPPLVTVTHQVAEHASVPAGAVWPPTLAWKQGYLAGFLLESSGPLPPGSHRYPYSAASTIPFTDRPGIYPDGTAEHLPADGFVIYAALAFPGTHPPPANPNFLPSRLPLQLSEFQVRPEWEGQVAPNVPEYLDWVAVGGQFLDVRVWFGSQSPSENTLDLAQRELDTLGVPPLPVGNCPNRPAPGVLISRSSGPAGSSIAVAGVQLPGANESGRIVGPGRLSFWWNLDPSKYWTAFGTTPTPASPGGPIVSLGVQGRSSRCGYEMVMKVPKVPVGTYTITPVVGSSSSSTSLQPLTFVVTASIG